MFVQILATGKVSVLLMAAVWCGNATYLYYVFFFHFRYTVILSVNAHTYYFKTYDEPAHEKFGRLPIACIMHVHIKPYFKRATYIKCLS